MGSSADDAATLGTCRVDMFGPAKIHQIEHLLVRVVRQGERVPVVIGTMPKHGRDLVTRRLAAKHVAQVVAHGVALGWTTEVPDGAGEAADRFGEFVSGEEAGR